MKLTVQLYTVRDALAKDIPGTLKAIAEAGLKNVEPAGVGLDQVETYVAALAENGLAASGAHFGIEMIETDFDGFVAAAKALGLSTVICPYISPDNFETVEATEAFAVRLTAAAEKVKSAGFQYLYHNHDFEMKVIDGKTGLERLLELIPASLLNLEVDLAWVQIGGGDPVEFLKKHADRIKMVHLKDFDPTKTPRWTVAGEGVVDYPAVIAVCKELGIAYGAVELDESPIDAVEAVVASAKYFFANGVEA